MVKAELRKVARAYGDARRTAGSTGPSAPVEFREEDYIVDEDAWVIVTRDGWIKRQKSFADVPSIRVRDDDRVGWVYRAKARHSLTFCTDRGVAYTLRANDIPLTTGHGEPIQAHFAFEDREHLVGVLCHDPRCLPDVSVDSPAPPAPCPFRPSCSTASRSTARRNGNGHAAPVLPPAALRDRADGRGQGPAICDGPPGGGLDQERPRDRPPRPGLQGRRRSWASSRPTGRRTFAWRRNRRACLIFPVAEANVVGGAAKGVTAIKLDAKDRVLGFTLANKMREGLQTRTSRGATLIVRATKYPVTGRGGRGFGVLQRGSLEAILHDDARPVPPADEVDQ